MRNLYVSLLVTHVLVAIMGVGLIGSVAVVASTARRDGGGSTGVASLSPLLRYSAISLGVMLVTGVLLNVAVGGAFNSKWWFRGSVLLLIAAGALHGQARRALRSGMSAGGDSAAALRRVEGIAYVMCALVAAITILMEVKPF